MATYEVLERTASIVMPRSLPLSSKNWIFALKEVSIDTRMVVSALSKSTCLSHLASKPPCSSISSGLVLV